MQKTQNDAAPFQRIPAACRITGMSTKWLREGCKSGFVPHCMAGNVYMVNVPALLRKLDAESEARP